jgi:hypothetical protein
MLPLVSGSYWVRAAASDAVANVGVPSLPVSLNVLAGEKVYLPLVLR